MTANSTSYVYVGLAGETAPGRPIKSGLYRMAVGEDRWEQLTHGLPDAPAIRAGRLPISRDGWRAALSPLGGNRPIDPDLFRT